MATLSRRSALMLAGGGTVALVAGGAIALQQGVLTRSAPPHRGIVSRAPRGAQ